MSWSVNLPLIVLCSRPASRWSAKVVATVACELHPQEATALQIRMAQRSAPRCASTQAGQRARWHRAGRLLLGRREGGTGYAGELVAPGDEMGEQCSYQHVAVHGHTQQAVHGGEGRPKRVRGR